MTLTEKLATLTRLGDYALTQAGEQTVVNVQQTGEGRYALTIAGMKDLALTADGSDMKIREVKHGCSDFGGGDRRCKKAQQHRAVCE